MRKANICNLYISFLCSVYGCACLTSVCMLRKDASSDSGLSFVDKDDFFICFVDKDDQSSFYDK